MVQTGSKDSRHAQVEVLQTGGGQVAQKDGADRWPALSLSPAAPVLACRSLPAKSTRFNLPYTYSKTDYLNNCMDIKNLQSGQL